MSARRAHVARALAVAALTTFVYAQSVDFSYLHWDDTGLFVNNPYVSSVSPRNLRRAFVPGAGARSYQPIRDLSYMIESHLTGGRQHRVSHGVNVGLGVAGSVAAYGAACSLGLAPGAAAVAAAVFSVHPVHAEGVAWVSGRKDLLCALFFLLALWAFRRGHPVATALLAALAMGSKATGVALPVVLALDLLILRRIPLREWRRWLIPLLPTGLLALGIAGAVLSQATASGIVVDPFDGGSAPGTMARIWLRYVGTALLPVSLNARYHVPASPGLLHGPAVGSALILAALGALAWRSRRRRPLVTYAAGLWVATLLPVSQIVRLSTPMADRYLYLPLFGFALALGLAAGSAARRWPGGAIRGAVAFVVLAYAAAGLGRTAKWRNDCALWEDAASKPPVTAITYNQVGQCRYRSDDHEGAVPYFRKAIRMDHRYPHYHSNLGKVLARLGKSEEAIGHFKRALERDPGYLPANLELARIHREAGEEDKALAQLAIVAKAPTWDVRVQRALMKAYRETGRHDLAIGPARKAAGLEPNDAGLWNDLGSLMGLERDFDGAAEAYGRAVALQPRFVTAWGNLARSLALAGRKGEATEAVRRGLALEPADKRLLEVKRALDAPSPVTPKAPEAPVAPAPTVTPPDRSSAPPAGR
jgi:Flp pilus assembly protein TadD